MIVKYLIMDHSFNCIDCFFPASACQKSEFMVLEMLEDPADDFDSIVRHANTNTLRVFLFKKRGMGLTNGISC